MAKLKKIEAEAYPQEVIAEEEPRYLRRQKPVEIKRRKFGKKAWQSYFRAALIFLIAVGGAGALFAVGEFLLISPTMALASPSQVDLTGNHFASRASILDIFSADRGKSVLRVPLAERRAQIEALPWVEHATVRRALPNRIEVEIVERTPVAFLRDGTDLFLADKAGMILDRPLEADFRFPVVTGVSSAMSREDRARRMQLMSDFMTQIRQIRPDAGDSVSEIDLSDADDVQATFAGLQMGGAAIPGALLVHFGNSDFHDKFQVLLNNIGLWEEKAGRVASVDLRFEREVVVNPENPAPAFQPAAKPPVVVKPAPAAVAPVHATAVVPHSRLASEEKPRVSRAVHKTAARTKARPRSKSASKASKQAHHAKKRATESAR
ncbi:MAG TPA: FtsQ-type POTRA domain-containing protein [Candidatus Acidoferrales bacterium]|nr:FtsQ-type POTRA domain-containing protein [Candidatus Acidoferrales bacterium]